ncbi:MAG: FkbM family methyltransferase [Pyrinomonadaceae bacterium]
MPAERIRVEIVIPVYNRRETTIQGLRSLSRIDDAGLDVHVIVVDDGSTDGTSEAIRTHFPEVQIISGDGTLHYAAGTNRGISAALERNPDYIVTANDDSVFDDKFLHRLIETAASTPRSVVGAMLLLWNEPHKAFQVGFKWETFSGGWSQPIDRSVFDFPRSAFEVEGLAGNCVLIPAAAVRECGLMDEKKFPHGWGDIQYFVKMRNTGWKLMVAPRALVWCEPNTYPQALHQRSFREVASTLFLNRKHPLNFQRQFIALWESAPSKPKAVAAFSMYVFSLLGKIFRTGDNTMNRPFRAELEDAFFRMVRAYTFNTPISKGKYRAFMAAMDLCRTRPQPAPVPTKDGRRIWADFSTGMHTTVYFLGEYEKVITDIVRPFLREGRIYLDVGANFGWYTTLFRNYCGPNGEVHAFEPTPPSFLQLQKNFELMGSPENVHINNIALGEAAGELTINLFEGLSSGHASLSDQGRHDVVSYRCRIGALDDYLLEHEVGQVDFVKVDIEGAEMMFLKGAEQLFKQAEPPTMLMEMASQQTANFGYTPNDLIDFLRKRADYRFFKIDETSRELIKIDRFLPDDIGANVLCVSPSKLALAERTDPFASN